MKKYFVLLISVFICNILFAQLTFQKIFSDTGGVNSFDKAVRYSYCIDKTLDGGYIMGANTYPTGSGHASLIRLDSNGDTLWTRVYDFGGIETVTSIVATTDSGFIASIGGGISYLLKTDNTGDLIWSKSYNGTSYQDYIVIQTSDGGYATATPVHGIGAGSTDGYIVKTNSIGDTLWTRTIGGTLTDDFFDIKQTTDGGYIAVGRTRSFEFAGGTFDGYAVKFDNSGDTLWTKVYGTSESDNLKSVCQTTDGGYAIAGYNANGLFLIRTNAMGDTLFSKLFSNATCDAQSIKQTADGGFAIVGKAMTVNLDVLLIKTDGNGNLEWSKIFGSNNIAPDHGYDFQVTQDGGFIICGQYSDVGSSSTNSGAYLIKTDSLGNCLCDVATISLPVSNLNPLIGSGGILGNGGSVSVMNPGIEHIYIEETTFCNNVDIEENNLNQVFFTIFPNPTYENITIKLNKSSESKIVISDITGKTIKLISATGTSVNLSVADIQSGVFFLTLFSDTFMGTQKLVIQR